MITIGVILQEFYTKVDERRHVKAVADIKDGKCILYRNLDGAKVHELEHGLEGQRIHAPNAHLSGGTLGEAAAEHAIKRL